MARPATTQPGKTGGDDLDDGLELDPDLLAASDEEGGAGSVVDDEEIDRESGDLEDDNGDADQEVAEQGRKRKTEEGDDPAAAEKKRRKKEKEKERKARVSFDDALFSYIASWDARSKAELTDTIKRGPGSDPQSSPAAPTHLKSSELSALLLRSIRETLPVATAMELDDIMLPGQSTLRS